MRSGTFACLFGFVFCAGIGEAQDGVADPRPEAGASQVPFHVEVDGGTVTLRARDVVLKDLLEAVAQRGGVEMEPHVLLAGRVTLELDSVPMLEALSRILSGRNFALRYAEPPSAQASKLWVFPPRNRPRKTDVGPSRDGASPELIEAYARLARRRPALAGDDGKVRLAAVAELAASSRETGALAAAALFDGDAAVREEAIYGLGAAGGEIDLQILEQALADPARRVRRAAVEAIADVGGDDSAWALATALRDADAALREQTVFALGDVGGAAAIPVLRQALADEQGFVREAAAEVLEELSAED